MKLNFKSKKNNGITLIALVVTIIVLLILAGISISMLTGQNGILKRGTEAKNTTGTAQIDEQVKLSVAEALSNGLGTITDDNLKSALDSNLGKGKYTLTGDAANGWTITTEEKNYNISGNGGISVGEDEEPIKSNNYDIYAYLYDDGTLSLGEKNEPISGKQVLKEYGNIREKNYTSEIIEGNRVANTPWFEERESINNVTVLTNIYPKSTSNWFIKCSNLSIINNIENIKTRYVTDMSYMFSNCTNISNLDLSGFDTSNVIDMNHMFSGSVEMKLTEIKGIEKFNTSKVNNMMAMFQNCANLTSIDLNSFDTSNVTDMSYMFSGSVAMRLTEIKGIEKFNTSKVTNMMVMFQNCINLISINLSSFDTSNVTDMRLMFAGGSGNQMGLTEIKGIEKFNASKVISMKAMFQNCVNLTSLDLSSFYTRDVTDTSYMFAGGSGKEMKLKEIKGLENFNVSKVTSMKAMFQNCIYLTDLNLISFETNNVSDMSYMFWNCTDILNINLDSFDTRNVTNMSYMFAGGSGKQMKLIEIKGIEKFNTSKVTSMRTMFQNCVNLQSLDLSSFDTNNVTDMAYMFSGTKNLKNIYVGSNWTLKNVTSSKYMYSNSGVSSTTIKS